MTPISHGKYLGKWGKEPHTQFLRGGVQDVSQWFSDGHCLLCQTPCKNKSGFKIHAGKKHPELPIHIRKVFGEKLSTHQAWRKPSVTFSLLATN